jgi:hypothetical protein
VFSGAASPFDANLGYALEQKYFQYVENHLITHCNAALARYPLAIPFLRFTSFRNTLFRFISKV